MRVVGEATVSATEELVQRAAGGDADAFSALIGRYERVALSVAYGVLCNADAAGDVVQEAFLRAWQRLAELKEPAHFATWICGIVRNLAIDVKRRDKRLRLAGDSPEPLALAALADPLSHDPLDDIDRREQRELVARALQSLDEVTRPAVVLRYYEGLSSKEIGEALGMSPAAVDMRLSRARQQLKKLLAPKAAAAE